MGGGPGWDVPQTAVEVQEMPTEDVREASTEPETSESVHLAEDSAEALPTLDDLLTEAEEEDNAPPPGSAELQFGSEGEGQRRTPASAAPDSGSIYTTTSVETLTAANGPPSSVDVQTTTPPRSALAESATRSASATRSTEDAALTEEAKAGLRNLVASLGDPFFQDLIGRAELSDKLPVLDQRPISLHEISPILRDTVLNAVTDALDANAAATTADIVRGFTYLDGTTVEGFTLSVDSQNTQGAEYVASDPEVQTDQFLFDVVLAATRTISLPLSAGTEGEAARYALDGSAMVDVNLTFDIDLQIGFDLADGLGTNDRPFFRFHDVALRFDVDVDDLAADLRVGFFNATVTGGRADMNGSLTLDLANPDGDGQGKTTLGEINRNSVSNLVSIQASGATTLVLPASLGIGDYSASGDVTLEWSDFSDATSVSVTASNAEFANFTSVESHSMQGLFRHLRNVASQLSEVGDFAADLPFVAEWSIGDALDFGRAIQEDFLDPLTTDDNQPSYDALDELLAGMVEELGLSDVGSIDLGYDPASNEFTLALPFSASFPSESVKFRFNESAGGLAELRSGGLVEVSGGADMTLTFGIDLTPLETTLVANSALPSDGVLSERAVFDLQVQGRSTPDRIIVTRDTDNTSPADLVDDINGAFASEGIADQVVAELGSGDRLVLRTTGALVQVAYLRINRVSDNLALNDLGFTDGQESGDSLVKHAFVEDASIQGSASVSFADLDAFGRFGFLSIDVAGADGSVDVTLNSTSLVSPDTGTAGGRIALPDLIANVSPANIDGVLPNLQSHFDASLSATLPVTVSPNLLGDQQPDNAQLTLEWTDLFDTDTLAVNANADMARLLDYEAMNFDTVADALGTLVDVFADLAEDTDLLDYQIPLLNTSVADLVQFADDFEDAVNQIRQNPAATLQELERFLEAALGLDPATDPQEVELTLENDLLKLNLMRETSFLDDSYTLDVDLDRLINNAGGVGELDLSGVSQLIDVEAAGTFTVEAGSTLNLALGIDLSTPSAPKPVLLDDTAVDLTLSAVGSDIDFTLGFASLQALVRDGTVDVSDGSGNPIGFRAGLAEKPGGYALDTLQVSDFQIDLPTGGQAGATLPLYFPDHEPEDHLGDLVFQIGDLTDPANTTTIPNPPDLNDLVNSFDLSDQIGLVIDGLDLLLKGIEEGLDVEVFGQNLPLVGDKLSDAADFVGEIRTSIQTIRDEVESAPTAAVDFVQTKLFEALDGIGMLVDRADDGDDEVTKDDIVITPAAPGPDTDEITFDFTLGQPDYTLATDIDFDIGVPALGLEVEEGSTVAASMGFTMPIKFGIHRTEGFYFDTAETGLNASLDVRIPDFSATGTLAFLAVDIADEDADGNPDNNEDDQGNRIDADGDGILPSELGMAFDVAITDPGGGGDKLTFDEIAGGAALGDIVSATFSGGAAVNLDMMVEFRGQEETFPSVGAQFAMDWSFSGSDVGTPAIAFNDVTLDGGEFLSDFLAPIVTSIQDVTKPLDPVINALATDLPIVNKSLAEAAGIPIGFVKAVQAINNLAIPSADQLVLELGSFEVGQQTSGDVTELVIQNESVQDARDQLENAEEDIKEFLRSTEDLGDSGSGFQIPLIDDPTSAFQLLLGQNVDLFEYDVPALDFEAGFEASFQIFPALALELAGSIEGALDLGFGYDTRGFRHWLESGKVAQLFDGFYVWDTDTGDDTGEDIAEGYIRGELTAGAKLTILIAEAGVRGGFQARVEADLRDFDEDGRVYADQFVASASEGLLCIFKVSGSFDVFVEAFAEVAGKEFGPKELANETLVEFETQPCFPGRFEASDSRGQAAPLGVAPGIHTTGDSIADPGDIDWYSFEVLREDSVDVLAEFNHNGGNLDIEVYDADNNRIARGKSKTDNERVTLSNLQPGTYFVQVFGHDNPNTYDLNIVPTPGASDTTVYYVNGDDTYSNLRNWHYFATEPGDDANSGLSPNKPKLTIQSLLDEHDLDANSLVHLDTGMYESPATITADDEGAIFAGVPWNDFRKQLDRIETEAIQNLRSSKVSPGQDETSITLDGASDTVFHNLDFGGFGNVVNTGGKGLVLTNGASNNEILDTRFDLQPAITVESAGTPSGNLIHHNTFSTATIRIDSDGGQTVRDNTIDGELRLGENAKVTAHDNTFQGGTATIAVGATGSIHDNEFVNAPVGITNHSHDIDLLRNVIRGGDVGMTGTGLLGSDTFANANEIHDNNTGVQLPSDAEGAVVQFNDIHDNGGAGVSSFGDLENLIVGNHIRNNAIGIRHGAVVGGGDWSNPNLITANGIGIHAAPDSEIRFNRVSHSNDTAIRISADNVSVHHNLVFRTGTDPDGTVANPDADAILVDGASGTRIVHNTVYATEGDAVRLANSAADTGLRNNILYSEGKHVLRVSLDSQAGFASNYNNLYAQGGAILVNWQKNFDDLYDWQVESRYDTGSLGSTDPHPRLDAPNFVDAANNDFHLPDDGSTSIDSADPADAFSNEPAPHGGRANLGAYGNTAEAAVSAASYVAVEYPEFHVDWVVDTGRKIQWSWFNVSGDIELDVVDGGGAKVADIATLPAGDGEYLWSPQASGLPADSSVDYRIRITAVDSGESDQSREFFAVPSPSTDYYVDDDADTDDEFTPGAVGDNRSTGRAADAPKASLVALIDMYDLGTGDTVHVDTGDHEVITRVDISETDGIGDDEAITVTGPPSDAKEAVLRRGTSVAGSRVLNLDNADFVTLQYLTLEDGERSLHAHNGTGDLTVTDLTLRDMSGTAIDIAAGDGVLTFHQLHIANAGMHGLYADESTVVVTHSRIANPADHGIWLDDTSGSRIESTTVTGGLTGIEVDLALEGAPSTVGHADLTQGKGNIVTGSTDYGMYLRGDVLASGNTITGVRGGRYGSTALRLYEGEASRNIVHDNENGILMQTGDSGTVSYNRVYNNDDIGIETYGEADLVGNVVHDNVTGIYVSAGFRRNWSGEARNNLVYDNEDAGIELLGTVDGSLLAGNTVYEPAAEGILVNATDAALRDNIVVVGSKTAIRVLAGAEEGFTSDYNLLRVTGGGNTGFWQGQERASLVDWRGATFRDLRSIALDPLFVDPDGADDTLGTTDDDFHLQSTQGSHHGGSLAPILDGTSGLPVAKSATVTADAGYSPAIDRGDADSAFDAEPAPNGGYVNLGAYGNTAQASLSVDEYLIVIAPDGGEGWPAEQSFTIEWRSHDDDGAVDIELLQSDGGGGLTQVQVIAEDTANDGTHDWTVPNAIAESDDYKIRITRQDDAGNSDASNRFFSITGPVSNYYVNIPNDGDLNDNVFTSAAGAAGNDGLTPATPKASIRGILDTYDLGDGDVILVDTGTYNAGTDITISAADAGVTIRGADSPTDPAVAAILDRGNTDYGNYAFQLVDADGTTFDTLTITGAHVGIYADSDSDSDNVSVLSSTLYGNEGAGIELARGNDNLTVEGGLFYGGYDTDDPQQDEGIRVDDSDGVTIRGIEARNHNSSGIVLSDGTGHLIENNNIHGGRYTGIGVYGATDTLVRGNTIHDNRGTGLDANGQDDEVGNRVLNNTVFGNERHGLDIARNTEAIGNTAYDNQRVGILVDDGATARDNVAYGNNIGMRVNGGEVGFGRVSIGVGESNRLYGNTTAGLEVTGLGIARNNLVYANVDAGVQVTNDGYPNDPRVIGNTIVQATGKAVWLTDDAENVLLRDNIIQTDTGTLLTVDADSQQGFASDYNLFHIAGAGTFASYGGETIASLATWFYEIGFDAHSFVDDPLFVDPDGDDNLLGYDGASDNGDDDDFHLQTGAPAIDAADPGSAFVDEPSPNGGRANLGAYGTTTDAATSSQTEQIHLISPSGQEKFEVGGVLPISWYTVGLPKSGTGDADFANVVSDQSPFAWYRLGEADGADTASDATDNNSDGTYAGDPTLGVDGAFGSGLNTAADLSGDDDRIDLPHTVLDGRDTLTITFWARARNGENLTGAVIGGRTSYDDFDPLQIWFQDPRTVLVTTGESNVENREFQIDHVSDGGWHHFALVRDSDAEALEFFVDGKSMGRQSATLNSLSINENELLLGGALDRQENLGFFHEFSGALDEVALFDRALSPSEIQGQYAANRGTLDIELVDAQTLNTVYAVATDDPDDGVLDWTIPQGVPADAQYRIRIQSDDASQPEVTSRPFQVANGGTDFYVNDDSTGNDVFTSAVGDNTNTGKTPDSPMRSLGALLTVYDVGTGDTIHIDTGTYTLRRTITLDEDAGGATFRGAHDPDNAASETVLDRNNRSRDVYAFNLAGADDLTFDRLVIEDAYIGIFAEDDAGSNNTRILNSTLRSNQAGGVVIESGNDGLHVENSLFQGGYEASRPDQDGGLSTRDVTNVTVLDSIFEHMNGGGLSVNGPRQVENTHRIEGNIARGNYSNGLGVSNAHEAIVRNNTSHSHQGGYGFAISVHGDSVTVDDNETYDNRNGLSIGVNDGGTATGNLSYDNEDRGFDITGPLRLENNTAHGNEDGVDIERGAMAVANTVYNNSRYGIRAEDNVLISRNRIYANDVGVYLRGEANDVRNNVLYQNANSAVYIEVARRSRIRNNTIRADNASALVFRSGQTEPVSVHNNILQIIDGTGFDVEVSSQDGLISDYNLFDLQGTATLATWGSTPVADRTEWHYELGFDAHSLTADPAFVDPDGHDDALGYDVDAAANHGADDDFRLNADSPAVDRGHPDHTYHAEPEPDGRRLNIGAFGNTADAATSDAPTLTLVTPHGLEKFLPGQEVLLRWITDNAESADPDERLAEALQDSQIAALLPSPVGTVDIQLIDPADGSVALTVAQGLDNLGEFAWQVPGAASLAVDATYRIRVTSSLAGQPSDESPPFQIANQGADYYLNDDATDHDVLTTAIGDNANTGKRADAPMASLTALLAAYDLRPGDTVHVDSGHYPLLRDATVDSTGLTIVGPAPDAGDAESVAVFHRQGTGYAFHLQDADDLTLRHLDITAADQAIVALDGSDSDNVTLDHLTVHENEYDGVYFEQGNDHLTVSNSLFFGGRNTQDVDKQGTGIDSLGSNAVIRNSEFRNHLSGGIRLGEEAVDSLVQGNHLHDNGGTAISVGSHRYAAPHNTVVRDNHVHHNSDGISVHEATGTIVRNNRVHNQDGYNATGISLYSDGRALDNEVWNNEIGIRLDAGTTAERNHVYANVTGISADGDALGNWIYRNDTGVLLKQNSSLTRNRIFDNATAVTNQSGYYGGFQGAILNNLIYDNTDVAIHLKDTGDGARVVNNTLHHPVGTAIKLTDGSEALRAANNILWIQTGAVFDVASDSQTGFNSDWNLFFLDGDEAKAGVWGGTDQVSFADWRTASGGESNSLTGDPLLVDLDGADDVLGFSETAGNVNGSADDNLQLAAGSPAIDRGLSFTAPDFDINGFGRVDDEGSDNLGGDRYAQSDLGASEFDPDSGTAADLASTGNATQTFTLPFSFPFYEDSYTEVQVSNSGFLRFGDTSDFLGRGFDEEDFLENVLITPMWSYTNTGETDENVYIDDTVDGQWTARWQASYGDYYAEEPKRNFAVTLFNNGNIRFDYGADNTEVSPGVGLSMGNEIEYTYTPYHSPDTQTALTDANSILFERKDGILDIGAFEFLGSSLDTTPPTVTDVTPGTIDSQGTVSAPTATVELEFSEALDLIEARARSNYTLLDAGDNGTFGDFDDTTLGVTPSYTAGETTVQLAVDTGVLTDGSYRLTLSGEASIRDQAGLRLDGDEDGNPGGNWVREFSVDLPAAGVTVQPTTGLETSENGATAQFTVVLDAQPGADVAIDLASSDTGEGTLSTNTLTFTPDNWDSAQTVTITGVNELLEDGDVNYTVTLAPATSKDARYDGLDPDDVQVTNIDNDPEPDGPTATLNLQQDWNFIALPLAPEDDLETLFDAPAIESVYQWDGHTYTLPDADTSVFTGLWVRASQPTTLSYVGTAADQTTVPLNRAWNAVGTALAPGETAPLPDNPDIRAAYTWNATTQKYHKLAPGDTLESGQALWIFSSAPNTTLNLTPTATSARSPNPASAYTNLFDPISTFESENSLLTARRADTWTERYRL